MARPLDLSRRGHDPFTMHAVSLREQRVKFRITSASTNRQNSRCSEPAGSCFCSQLDGAVRPAFVRRASPNQPPASTQARAQPAPASTATTSSPAPPPKPRRCTTAEPPARRAALRRRDPPARRTTRPLTAPCRRQCRSPARPSRGLVVAVTHVAEVVDMLRPPGGIPRRRPQIHVPDPAPRRCARNAGLLTRSGSFIRPHLADSRSRFGNQRSSAPSGSGARHF